MATTFVDYTGDGNATKSFSFPSIKEADIKVEVDDVLKTSGNHYNITSYTTTGGGNVVFTAGNIPANPAKIRILRDTDVDSAKATYTAGSSVKAGDLNSNQTQALYAAQEEQNQIRTSRIQDIAVTTAKVRDLNITTAKIADSAVTSAKIADGTIVNADVNASAAIAGTKVLPQFGSQSIVTTGTAATGAHTVTGNIIVSGNVDGRDVAADGTKLDGIESGATQDQSASEIRALVESASDSNVFTDADHSKLNAIEAGATADQTNAEIRAAVEAATDSNVFTDADHTKLNGIETAATADQTASEIKTLLQSDKITNAEIATGTLDGRYYTETETEALFLRQDSSETIASGVSWSSNDSKVATTAAIDARIIDLVDDVGGFVPIANETSFPTANPDVNNGAGTLVSIKAIGSSRTPSTGTVTIANGAGSGNTVTITGCGSTVLAAGFGAIVETTTTLHTYTFHRLVPKATEVTTVAANATNISAAGANVTNIDNFANRYQISTSAPTTRSNSSSLVNGDLWFDSSSNKVMMVYDGSAGDGFSPITPNQASLTNINIVAGQITFTEDLGNITDAVNTGSGNNSVNTVAASIANVNTAAGAIANINTTATNIANVNNVGGSIANVNTVGGAIANVNRYADEYVIQSSTPSSPSAGDLWYNTTANNLNYYTGGAWVAISPGIAGLINDGNPALANHLDCNDKNLTEVGTVSGNNLQIDFGTI